jgi:hypothetical protein
VSKPIGLVRARTHRLLLACVMVVLVGLPLMGSDWVAESHAAVPARTTVRDIQKRLAELKFLPIPQVDGKLGPRTRDAITAFQQWNSLTPDGIVGPQTLGKLRTAGVPRHSTNGPPRRIEIYRAKGVTLLVESGSIKRAIHSSAGKRGYETPTGSYRVQRKVLNDWSRPYRTAMPYASYLPSGYALHEGAVPSYPASHGCVRLPSWDAADVYRFATVGTTVVVH